MKRTQRLGYYINRSFALNFFITPIYIVYLTSYGLSYSQIAWLHIVRDISILLFEIPFGVIADWIGRKTMVYLSGILAIIAVLSFISMPTFSFFIIAFAMWGGAIAADSGTVSALMYENLEDKKEHKLLVSNSEVFRKLTHSIVNFGGGILYLLHKALPFIGSIILVGVSLIAAYFIPNAQVKKVSKKVYFSKLSFLFKNRAFLLEIMSISVMISSFSLVFMYQQPRLQNIGIEEKYFGLIFGGLLLIGMIGSYYLRHFDIKQSKINSFCRLNGLMFVAMFLMAFRNNLMITLLAMVLLALLNGLIYPLKFVVMNQLIEDEVRSGVLSIQSYMEFLLKVIVSLSVSFVADHYSVERAIQMISLIPLILLVIFGVAKLKKMKQLT